MVWFKVDDGLAFHAKTIAAGNPAMGLWVRAGSWCADQLTDGFVPDHVIPTLGTHGQAKSLVNARLWIKVEGGYQFWQWNEDDRQPTRAKVEEERAAARERMRLAREKKRAGSGEVQPNTGRSSPEVRSTPTRPDPTRPIEELKQGGDVTEPSAPVARVEYPDHCLDHRYVQNPPPCGGCKEQREANRRTDRRHLAAVPDCPRCGGTNWIETDDGRPAAKCNHLREAK